MNAKEIRSKIENEIIMDCYDDQEISMGWYYFFQDELEFPFEVEISLKTRNGGKKLIEIDILKMVEEERNYEISGLLFEVSPKEAELIMEIGADKLKNTKGSRSTKEAFEIWFFWNSDKY